MTLGVSEPFFSPLVALLGNLVEVGDLVDPQLASFCSLVWMHRVLPTVDRGVDHFRNRCIIVDGPNPPLAGCGVRQSSGLLVTAPLVPLLYFTG